MLRIWGASQRWIDGLDHDDPHLAYPQDPPPRSPSGLGIQGAPTALPELDEFNHHVKAPALQLHLHFRSSTCVLWIDAICINARENKERTLQVLESYNLSVTRARTKRSIGHVHAALLPSSDTSTAVQRHRADRPILDSIYAKSILCSSLAKTATRQRQAKPQIP
jgi:hypothetical protein